MGSRDSARFKIDIQSLAFKQHEYEFESVPKFFESFENSPVSKGSWSCFLILDKSETMIQLDLKVSGLVELVCDRSLRTFDYSLEFDKHLIYKFGEEWEELDDEIMVIPRNLDQLDIGSVIFEYIILNIPMKKVHPDLIDEEQEDDHVIFTTDDFQDEENDTDPRWENLKKIKNK